MATAMHCAVRVNNIEQQATTNMFILQTIVKKKLNKRLHQYSRMNFLKPILIFVDVCVSVMVCDVRVHRSKI